MQSLYEVLKASKLDPNTAPDGITALRARMMMSAAGGKTQTLTDVPPLSFKANGNPLTSWSMSGNGEQNGTPTPDAPIQPQFVGVRTGNLLDPSTLKAGYLNTFGLVSAQDGTKLEFTSDFIPISSNDYTWSLSEDLGDRAGWVARVFYDANKEMVGSRVGGSVTKKSGAFSTPSEAVYVRISWRSYGSIALSLSTGVNELPYEPFGYKIPITCAGQTVSVYLGQTQTVRRIKKYVFTGEENGTIYSTSTSRKGIEITGITGIIGGTADIVTLAICTHYQPYARNVLYRNTDNGISNAYRNDNIIFYDANCQTVEAFQQFCAQQYAAGTPVTVWYVLVEPETGIVDEPLAKIGDYADELNSEDAGVRIPTVKGQNTLTVDTELQPSEMTITYKE